MNKERRLKEEIKILESEIKLKQSEINKKKHEIKLIRFETISWEDLKAYLLALNKKSAFDNPVVYSLDYFEPCTTRIVERDGVKKLQVGSYFYNDRTPRGKDVKIFKDKRSWNENFH